MTWSKWKSFQIKLHHAKRILILEITSGYLEPFHKLSYLTYNLINIYHSDPKEKKKNIRNLCERIYLSYELNDRVNQAIRL